LKTGFEFHIIDVIFFYLLPSGAALQKTEKVFERWKNEKPEGFQRVF